MIKKRLLSLLVLLAAVVTGAVAQGPWTSGACTVTLSGGVLTVSGTGAMENYADYSDTPWNGYASDIKTIVIESGVTGIGQYAFAECTYLESVSIPASVTSIGKGAFEDGGYDATTALTVSFAEGSTLLTIGKDAFQYANLKSIDIPNSVTSIGNYAFSDCSILELVSIPASVTSIGNFAFKNCGSGAAALTVSFAEGSTPLTISNNAFFASNLKSIDIPNRVTSIGDYAFQNCTHLKSVSIPASVTSIGYSAFVNCADLESVSIPASVTSIGDVAFGYCGMLAKVYIYAPSLTTYGIKAFDENAAGRKIYVRPEAVDTYKAGWPKYAADIEAMTLYTTSVKEGTEDAENWSATPSQATEGQKVTINYAGTKSVKSVTAKRKATTGNIMVYFTDAMNWGDVNVYYWDNGPDWPGMPMTYVETNGLGQNIYRAEIPATAVGIVFNNNNNGKQTADITDNLADGSWWYTINNSEVGYVGKYTENIEVTNVDDNNWTFTMTDGNVELDIEYYPAHPVTISDGDVDAANWSATPTEQSVGQNVTLQYNGRKKIKRITIVPAAIARTAAEATAEDIGKLIGADGNIYDDAAAATAASTTAVAVIAYVGSDTYDATFNHGLAIALADEEGFLNWSTAKSTCEGKTAITGAKWCLPSQEQWKQMFKANGGDEESYTGLNTTITNAGGTTLQDDSLDYWSSSKLELDENHAYYVLLEGGNAGWYDDVAETWESLVRACLVF